MPNKPFIRTALHKQHISEALTGRKLSAEHARRMGLTKIGNKNMLGKHLSVAAKLKLSKAHTGKKLTPEHRKKIALAVTGRPGSMLGKKHTAATRHKMSLAHRGEKHHFWRGGITPLNKVVRHTAHYKLWRSTGFARDGYFCILGGKDHGSKLHFDHIKKFSDIMIDNNILTLEAALECEELWDVKNGRTLCETCHRKTDTWGRKKPV